MICRKLAIIIVLERLQAIRLENEKIIQTLNLGNRDVTCFTLESSFCRLFLSIQILEFGLWIIGPFAYLYKFFEYITLDFSFYLEIH